MIYRFNQKNRKGKLNMTFFTITLVSLVMGFVAGTVSSLATVEAKTEDLRKEMNDVIRGLESSRTEAKKAQEDFENLNRAFQVMIQQFKRDRGGIWQSLNDLWNSFDKMTAPVTQEQPKPEEKKKTVRKAKKKESVADGNE
jgi:nitrogen fixation/metabolism regulation signal transduction histidine kinase